MTPGCTIRFARPTDRLEQLATMYADGLGLSVLDSFADHEGFDGVILGHHGQPYHLEFTRRRGHRVGLAPSKEHLLVFYIPDAKEWAASCARMTSAGFRAVQSVNPFWDRMGATFEDIDGYRVVLSNRSWPE